MKVLWLSTTPGGASEVLKYKYPGGGWISSMEAAVKKLPDIDLALCFFYNHSQDFKFLYNEVTYYPIKDKYSSRFGKVKAKLFNELPDSNLRDIIKVLHDFKPDIIQLFGTETGLGEIIAITKVPIILYIQGIINPYVYNWFPKGVNQTDLFFKSSIFEFVFKKGFLGYYYVYKKMAIREQKILNNIHYVFGRTDWDRRVVKLYNTSCEYMVCNDTLRHSFFCNKWEMNNWRKIKLVSTLNPNIYKGLETILKAAELIRLNSDVLFEWNIIGISEDSQLVRSFEKISKVKYSDNHVFFKGQMNVEELILELKGSHIFIHPSHIENSPNAVCEAMLLGMPVIVGFAGGVSSVIENNVNGLLFNSHDPYDLAGLIKENINDVSKLKCLGENARKHAFEKHNPEDIASNINNTYKRIVLENNTKCPL